MNSVLLILFILFSLLIIFISNIYVLLGLVLLCFIGIILYKVKVEGLKGTVYFFLFIFGVNALLLNLYDSTIILLRLVIMYLLINMLIKKIGLLGIASCIANIFHSKDLYLIISIALTFIPIFRDEIVDIKKGLIAKNFDWRLFNIIKNSKILVVTFFHNLFRKVDILEKVILSKGY